MIDFNRHIEIENYLQDNLTPEERAAFEAKIASDSNLREEVELQKLANSVVIGGAKLDIKNELNNIHSNFKKEKKNKQRLKWLIIITTVLLAVTYVLTSLNKTKEERETENLYSQNNKATQTSIKPYKRPTQNIKLENSKIIKNEDSLPSKSSKKQLKRKIEKSNFNEPNQRSYERDSIRLSDSSAQTIGDIIPGTDIISDSSANSNDSVSNSVDGSVVNRCAETETWKPKYITSQPCFGKNKGSLQCNDNRFEHFILSNSPELYSPMDELEMPIGNYTLIGIDERGCRTNPIKIEIKYENCQFSIRPDNMQYFEFSVESEEIPLIFTLRNARSGFEVYKQLIDGPGDFEYKGNDNNGTPLPMGNYVYFLAKPSGEFITQGQLTIVR